MKFSFVIFQLTLVSACAQTPVRPAVGRQIDRMGAPTVSNGLIKPISDEASKGLRKDQYNAAASSEWASFVPDIKAALALVDALDAICGNQLLAGVGTGMDSADRYQTLAQGISDDRLWINSASTTCTVFQAVQADAMGFANQDCGGRTPLYDVIDVGLSTLVLGAPAGASDGVDADDAIHSNTEFPFLAAP